MLRSGVPVAAFAAGCNLDVTDLEASVRADFEKQGIHIESIDCPRDRPRKDGDVFECRGRSATGFPITVSVVQKERGASWTFPGHVSDLDSYSRGFVEQFNMRADCGTGPAPIMKGTKISCLWQGKSAEFAVADDHGNLDYGDLAEKFGAPGAFFDVTELETSIRAGFEKQGVTVDTLVCPRRVREEGDAFKCEGKTDKGVALAMDVVQKAGGANWNFRGVVLDLDGYSKRFGERFAAQADCGEGAMPIMKGSKITCRWDGKTAVFTVTDDEGNIDYGDFYDKFIAGSGDPDGAPK